MDKYFLSPTYLKKQLLSSAHCLQHIRKIRADYDLGKAIDFVFSPKASVIRPSQNRSELVKFLALVAERKPRNVIEIGSASGGNLFLLTRIASPNSVIVSIDLPGGEFGGGYRRWRIPLYLWFARPGQRIHLIRGDSHAPETLSKVMRLFKDRRVDLLFIDGDHSYSGVKQDFEMYSKLVRYGGIIALHDIKEHPPELHCEVHRYWQEIKTKYQYVELVEDQKARFGIGLLAIER